MSEAEQTDNSEKEMVAVTKHRQAIIPKRFREKLRIEAPRKVLFRETEDGDVIVKHVRSPSEMRRFAARSAAATDTPASEIPDTSLNWAQRRCGDLKNAAKMVSGRLSMPNPSKTSSRVFRTRPRSQSDMPASPYDPVRHRLSTQGPP